MYLWENMIVYLIHGTLHCDAIHFFWMIYENMNKLDKFWQEKDLLTKLCFAQTRPIYRQTGIQIFYEVKHSVLLLGHEVGVMCFTGGYEIWNLNRTPIKTTTPCYQLKPKYLSTCQVLKLADLHIWSIQLISSDELWW